MNEVTNSFNTGLRSFFDYLPALLGGLLLILAAWVVAILVRKAIEKGLRAVNLDAKLVKWGAAESEEQARSTIDTFAMVFYYLVWVLFLPGIFQAFGLSSIAAPFTNMIQTALNYVPNIIGAAIILILGFIAAKFVRNLVYNLSKTLNVDRWMNKLTGEQHQTSVKQRDTFANVLGTIVYVLILIPIITAALETLNIRSISAPIINVLNVLLSAIPNILVAVILLAVGIAIAKFVGDLLARLLQGTGINNIAKGINFNIADAIGNLVAVLIGLFFFVEALNVLNLAVLNTIGGAIIAYLPNILFALIILGLAVVGGQLLANLVTRATGSRFTGKLLEVILLVFGTFMALSQLRLATSIVNTAFIFIIGGLAVAFAIAFGMGGRDFAHKQLEKLDTKMEKEKNKNDQPPHQELDKKMKEAGEKVSPPNKTTEVEPTRYESMNPKVTPPETPRMPGDDLDTRI